MIAEQTEEHRWLEQLTGDWTFEVEADMGGGETHKHSGSETVRSLKVWIQCEGVATMGEGAEMRTVMTLGYDPAKKKFVGSFIGSMMTHQWIYEGELDAAKKILTLDTEGPSFSGDGSMVRYRDIIELVSPGRRLLRSETQQADGSWKSFMKAEYRKTGS